VHGQFIQHIDPAGYSCAALHWGVTMDQGQSKLVLVVIMLNRSQFLLPAAMLAAGVPAGWFLWPDTPEIIGSRSSREAVREPVPDKSAEAPKPSRPTDPNLATRWEFIHRLKTAAPEEFPGLWEELKQQKPGKHDYEEFSVEQTLLAGRWAEVAPEAALVFFSKTERAPALVREVFRIWSRAKPETALAALPAETDKQISEQALAGIVSGTGGDPASLIAWGRRLAVLDGKSIDEKAFDRVVPPEVLRKAFAHDPASCRELAAGLPPWFTRRLEAFAIGTELVTNLPAALARMDAAGLDKKSATGFLMSLFPMVETRPDKVRAVMEHLTTSFGEGWFVEANDDGSGGTRPLFIALAKSEPDKVRELLHAATDPKNESTDMARASAAEELFESDPRAALQLAPTGCSLQELWHTGGGDVLLDPQVTGSPPTMLALVRDAPGSMMRDTLLQQALTRMNPEDAAAWVGALPAGELQDVARAFMENKDKSRDVIDLEVARASAGTDADPALLDRIRLLAIRAGQSGAETVAARFAEWPDSPARTLGLETAAKAWAWQDPAGAVAWSETLPPATRATALGGVLERWAADDPSAASECLANLPEDVPRDVPASALARGLVKIDAAASVQWAATVQDPALRRAALEFIAGSIAPNDSDAVCDAFQKVPGLSDAERQLINARPRP
jgi:hypothetical protein